MWPKSWIENVCILSLGLGLRAVVSLYSYSGARSFPKYGDFEAQRHWQEITVNLPALDWYKNGTENDLMYWGLDYPPLSAYHSFAMGKIAQLYEPESVALLRSRGYETKTHKSYMRLTVIIADIFVYIPALLILSKSLESVYGKRNIYYTILSCIYPGQLLIDNGHFQYNNISLGLAAAAIAAILRDRHNLSALLFTLSLNYKQMSLYLSIPFFSYLLKSCFLAERSLLKFVNLAIITSVTCCIIWLPWIRTMEDFMFVLKRLFPMHRGVFEDKVGNFWCAFNTVLNLRNNVKVTYLALMCLTLTAASVVPINAYLYSNRTHRTFMLSLFSTAMAFFLFSFQVHEKSILLAALPAFCLFYNQQDFLCFIEVSAFSMFPLLMRDGLGVPFCLTLSIFRLTFKAFFLNTKPFRAKSSSFKTWAMQLITYIAIAIIIAQCVAPPPKGLEYIWELLISLLSFIINVVFFLWTLFKMIRK